MRERKLIEPMRERLAGDRNAKLVGVGEIREALATRRMLLHEEDLAFAAVSSAPLPHTALERPKRTWPVFAWALALELLQERDGAEVRVGLQQRQKFGFPDLRQRIWASTPLTRRALRGERFEGFDSAGASLADTCLRGSGRLPARLAVGFEPDGDILPVRAAYDESTKDWQVGVNYLHTGVSGEKLWYSLPDVAASLLLTGRMPRISRAIRLVPKDTVLIVKRFHRGNRRRGRI
jgi:hypothetical protein